MMMVNFIFYGMVSPYWVKIAPKLVGLRINGFSVYEKSLLQGKPHMKVLPVQNQT